MNNSLLYILLLSAGALISIQSTISGSVSKIVGNSLISSVGLYFTSLLIGLTILLSSGNLSKSVSALKENSVMWLLLLAGGLSICGLSCVYWAIPRIGISKVICFVIAGQVFCSLVIAHYGLFNSIYEPISTSRVFGGVCMVVGVYLINRS